ncbi:MAG: hypothetical protein P4L92_15240 [Rudaea sp.]|nr:hypothetical protein [Rudaea sp.]
MKRPITQLCLSFLLLLALSPMAFAQATRTWVSGVGDDANPCSRTAPCKTWAGAISKTAAGGEMDALDPGGFGALTITKAITLDGGGGQVASILVSGTDGIVVNAGAGDTIILRNLRLNGISGTGSGGLNGITFLAGQQLVVENCEIFGFTQNAINVNLNQTTTANVVVHNSNFTLIGQNAASFTNSNTGNVFGSLSNVAIRGAVSGVTTSSANVFVDISNSTVAQTTGFGLHAVFGSISAENNMLTGNTTAVRAESNGTVRLSNNGIYNNVTGVRAVGSVPSATNNRNAGNTVAGAPNGTITIQ